MLKGVPCPSQSATIGIAFVSMSRGSFSVTVTQYLILAFILVGCESSRQSASLNADQAKTRAMGLANDKAAALYHSQPFVAGQPAQFVAGHWLWRARQGMGHGDIQATVELAMDGSTNNVDLQLFQYDTPNPLQGGGRSGGF
jgi:hypothetical protein